MIFFLDRNIGIRLARMLDAYDAQNTIRHHDEDARFSEQTKDTFLIKTLAGDDPKPVFITADVNMWKRHPDERKALARSGLTVVFLRKRFHHMDFHSQAVKLLGIWPEIARETGRLRRPSAFELTPSARKLQLLGPTEKLA